MGILAVFFLACALAMDAFAVSLCKGFCARRLETKNYFIVGAYFGGFGALMPIFGFLLGEGFAEFVGEIDHYIAFVLLLFVGAKMIKESYASQENSCEQFEFKTMFALAVATSIDAFAIGVSFAFVEFQNINVWQSIAIIGIVTFIICILGLQIGHKFGCNSSLGSKLGKKAEFIGGLVLILLGVKILIEHLS